MPENGNGILMPEGSGKVWLYGGIGIAIIAIGIVIFHFATQGKLPQAKNPEAATSTPTAVQSATFPMGGATPDVSVSIQKTDNNSSGQSVVVAWKDLPGGTKEINVFRAAAEGSTSVLVGKIKIPSSSFFYGSSSFYVPSTTQDGYYYGTPSDGNGTSTPPGGGQGPSSTTSGNPPPSQGGGSTSPTSSGALYFYCAAGQCASTSTPGATSCDTACATIPASTILSVTCLPNSISVGQTSRCVLNLNGTLQNNVTWTVAFGSTGSISVDGIYTPSTAGTETITGTLPDGTSADGTLTVSSSGQSGQGGQSGSCPTGYILSGGSCVPDSSMTIQSSLTWNGNNYSVENGLYTSQDMVYLTGSTSNGITSITVYCSYSQYSVTPQSLGNGNYEISGLSSHGCNTPNSINYLDLGRFYGDGLNISIDAPQ